ncbi:hypothetical protein [Streptomyces bacillaris]|uniref:hypothetical protein n=1 Tax=Streptomyces bacillaris TaxID=68179 RepID=UPI00363EAE87
MSEADKARVRRIHCLEIPGQHVDEVEHRQVAVKKGVSPEAVGHLGIGVVVRLVAGVKELQKVVHEEIFTHLRRYGGGFLCVSRPEKDASAGEVKFDPAVIRAFEEFEPGHLTGAPGARQADDNRVLVVEEAVGELLQGGQIALPDLFDPRGSVRRGGRT